MSTIAMHHMARPGRAARAIGSAERKPGVRLTARGRAVLLAVLALPLAAGIGVAVMNGGAADATHDAGAPLQYVTVEPGETLWGLATELAPGADPREVIAELISINRLPSGDLQAGMSLAIPPQYAD